MTGATDRGRQHAGVRPSPVTWRQLRRLETYQEFTERYPWTVRPGAGGGITTEEDWREGVRRLSAYYSRLAVLRRRRLLRPGENPYADLIAVLSGTGPESGLAPPPGLANVLHLRARRRELAAVFSWAIPAEGVLAVIGGYAPLVECGAGTGYWAALLRARGVDTLAYDLAPPGAGRVNDFHRGRPWTEVLPGSSVAAAAGHPGRALLLCWPPYDDDSASYAVLRAFRGDTLLYIGEGPGGATGTARFHEEVGLNWRTAEQVALPRWPGLRDKLTVFRRNGTCLDTRSGTRNASAQATGDR